MDSRKRHSWNQQAGRHLEVPYWALSDTARHQAHRRTGLKLTAERSVAGPKAASELIS